MAVLRRRDVVASTVALLLYESTAKAGVISGKLPWEPTPPPPALAAGDAWQFFTAAEAAMMESVADLIIPPDPQTPGGREAGCAVFLDRQLAGAYGRAEGLYDRGPFRKGTEQQGPQDAAGPAERYRKAMAAIEQHCREHHGKGWSELTATDQEAMLHGLESGALALVGVDGKAFFEQLLKDVQQGFFADPIYGGNRDMCAWKMIGFPGARYDYRDWVDRHNERYPLPPVSIGGRPDWTPHGSGP